MQGSQDLNQFCGIHTTVTTRSSISHLRVQMLYPGSAEIDSLQEVAIHSFHQLQPVSTHQPGKHNEKFLINALMEYRLTFNYGSVYRNSYALTTWASTSTIFNMFFTNIVSNGITNTWHVLPLFNTMEFW